MDGAIGTERMEDLVEFVERTLADNPELRDALAFFEMSQAEYLAALAAMYPPYYVTTDAHSTEEEGLVDRHLADAPTESDLLAEIDRLLARPALDTTCEVTCAMYMTRHKITRGKADYRLRQAVTEGVLTKRDVLHNGKWQIAYRVNNGAD